MKNYVFPPDSKFLQTYGTTASTIFEPLYKALAARPDWEKTSINEPTIELPAGTYSLCEQGSARILTFHARGREASSETSIQLKAGENLRLLSQSGMPAFYLRIKQDSVISGQGSSRIWVEFLPIEAHDYQDGGKLQLMRTQAFDYCADERLSKVASTILDARNISNKTNLLQTLSSYLGQEGFIPKSYQIQFGGWYGGIPDPKESSVWFLKNSTQDRASGIVLLSDPHEALERVDRKHRYVVQPALPRPRLIDGKKYDLRFYLAMAHNNQNRWFGVYRRGLIRKCPLPYVPDALDPAVQLSNYVPPEGPSAKFNEQKYELFSQASENYERVMSELDTIVQKLVHSTRFHLASRRFGRRFHLFSLDFALDEDLNLWLFEANNSPGLDIEHEQIQTSLISPLIDGLIDVAIDPLLTEAPPQASSDWSIWLD